jgi:serine/threonine protein kinase
MRIAPGENVGSYRVIEQLGSGGMATVFKAYHPSLDRYVALKVLHPAFKADPQFFERFKREARIVANLEHPNIIPIYDFNEHHGEPYLVMRFIEGDTLKPKLEGRPIPSDQILQLMRPVCQALDYAHNQGVLHRDIKPSNIMVTKDSNIFITDFGLARMVQAGESTLSQDMMIGTPQYISPEQAQGIGDLDCRTDIYSLGVVLFEMVTGQVPFNADTPFATVHDHIYSPLPLPSTLNPDIDPAVETMLLKALAKEPDDRYETVADLLQALETKLSAYTVASRAKPLGPDPVGQPQKSGTPWWVWAGSAALLLCILGVVLASYLLLGYRNRNIPVNEPVSAPVANNGQPVGGGQPAPPPPPGDRFDKPPPPPPPPGMDPNSPEYREAIELTEQANQAMREEVFDEAAEFFERAMAANPHHLPAYFGQSEALKLMGDEESSLAILEKAVENNPDRLEAYIRAGAAFLDEYPEDALDLFVEAAVLAPDAAITYAGQALALLAMDEDEAAKEAIDTALELNPTNPEAHLAKAIYQIKQGNRRAAVQELQRLVQNNRTSGQVRERAIQLLKELRD